MNRRSMLLSLVASPLAILFRPKALTCITTMRTFVIEDIARVYNLPASMLTSKEAK